MSELHILNGEHALELWKKCDFSARSLVWKETYLEGPLPQTADIHTFRSVRAGFLATFAELAAVDREALFRHLQKMDDAVLKLPPGSTLMLWFDACIFDQTILMRILSLLSLREHGLPEIFLYCCEGNCLSIDDFQRGKLEKVRLTPEDLKFAADAWQAFAAGDAAAMTQLAEAEKSGNLSKMKKALLRCAEEIPAPDGLNRSQRQILQLISSGKSSFDEIFSGVAAFEEFPFLGDTACLRLLEDLQRKGMISITQKEVHDGRGDKVESLFFQLGGY